MTDLTAALARTLADDGVAPKHADRLAGLLEPVVRDLAPLPDLIGIPDIKTMFGHQPHTQTVEQWRNRGRLPEPELQVGRTPIWRRRTILEWAVATGRSGRLTEESQARLNAQPKLLAAITDAISHPERAVPRQARR